MKLPLSLFLVLLTTSPFIITRCFAQRSLNNNNRTRQEITIADDDQDNQTIVEFVPAESEESAQEEARESKQQPLTQIPLSLPLPYDRAIEILEYVYKGTNAFAIPSHETEIINKSGGAATYGEITYDALRELMTKLNLSGKDKVLIVGSGSGKDVLFTALATPAKVMGVELSETRHVIARRAKYGIQKDFGLYLGRKAALVQKDILALSQKTIRTATVVLMSNLCYSDSFLNALTNKLEALKDGARIVTIGKELPKRAWLESIEKPTYMKMSWSLETGTPVYIYRVVKRAISY